MLSAIFLTLVSFLCFPCVFSENITCYRTKEDKLLCSRTANTVVLEKIGFASVTQGSAEIRSTDENLVLKAIDDGGLKAINDVSSLNIHIRIREIGPKSFLHLNLEKLELRTSSIDKCSFGKMNKLTNLTVIGLENGISLHKDSFAGLMNVKELEFRNISQMTTTSSDKNNQPACKHVLCAFRNLVIFRIQVNNQCHLISFDGIPPNTSINQFKIDSLDGRVVDGFCPIEKHDCSYENQPKCGYDSTCVVVHTAIVSTGMIVFLSVIIACVLLIAIGAALWMKSTESLPRPTALSA